MAIRRFDVDHGGVAAVVRAANEATVRPLTKAIYEDSQRYVPILTGDLKASGRIEYGTDGHGLVIYGDEGVDYAAYQEVGTSKMQAQPYLRPAAYQRRSL